MYFRFPILLLIIILVSIGLIYFGLKFQSDSPAQASESAETAELSESRTDRVVVADAGMRSISEAELQAHIHFLADDLLEGRDTGSRGARLAALYIANQFRQMGLVSPGENDSYFQPVPLSKRTVSPKSEISIEVDGEMIPLKYMSDFLVATAPPGKTELSADLVFTGFGIQAPEYDYDDFAGIDVADKATIYLSGEPDSDDAAFFRGQERTRYSRGRAKREIAESLNARASIGIARPRQLERIDWELYQRIYSRDRIELAGEQSSEETSDYVAVALHPDVGELIFSGSKMSFREILEAAETGKPNAFDLNRKVKFRVEVQDEEIVDRNVLGFIEGSDPDLKSEVVIFTAHYDHVGFGPPVRGDSIYNGAADNASGTAGLLELAEAFASLPEAPRRSLLFLAVTAEEKGLLGSEYYLRKPVFPIAKTVANFNLDMIGLGDTTGLVVYGAERSSLGDSFQRAAERVGLEILPDQMPEQRIFYRSDHYNFAKRGIPAIMPGFGLRRDEFTEFESYYHKPNDEPGLPFNYRYMRRHVQAVFLAGLAVANADEAPKWNPGDEFEKLRSTHDD